MKKKKTGFVATSLLYSFFLLFIAIIIALINSYMANKTILERFNETNMDYLNGEAYTIILQVKNATIIGNSHQMRNMLFNGDFKEKYNNKLTNWVYSNIASLPLSKTGPDINGALGVSINDTLGTHLYQEVSVVKDHKYYFAMTINGNINPSVQQSSYILNDSGTRIVTSDIGTSTGSTRVGKIAIAKSTESSRFMLSLLNNNNNAGIYYNNILLIDLTESYGKDNEPSLDYLNQFIDYFNGSINYIKKEWHTGDEAIKLNMLPYNKNSTIKVQKCKNQNGSNVAIDNKTIKVDQSKKAIQFENITSDLFCDIEWS